MEISTDRLCKDFTTLGGILHDYCNLMPTQYSEMIDLSIKKACIKNKWFTDQTCIQSLKSIYSWLNEKTLSEWVKGFNFNKTHTFAILMAGNIPLVGFHDLLSVLISGQKAIIKPSEKDAELMSLMIDLLHNINPYFKHVISIVPNLQNIQYDSIIATGSSSSSAYFNYYLGQKPSIIRGHRNAIAVLNGKETEKQLLKLGDDIFMYFGLGCRNISKIYIPIDYDLNKFNILGKNYSECSQHNKYMNNYQYYKTISVLNKEHYLDFGHYILKENSGFNAPPSIIHYEYYKNIDDVKEIINENKQKIQCLTSNINALLDLKCIKVDALGMAQKPKIDDYADQINTLTFINKQLT